MTTVYIYGLVDPRTQQLKYIGKTTRIPKRVAEHLYRSKTPRTDKERWMRDLANEGLRPEGFVIEEVVDGGWEESERFWISYFTYIGAHLTNGTGGGIGGATITGRKHSEETKRKISVAKMGNTSRLGKPHSEESRLKISLSQKGRPLSNEHKAKLRVGWKTRDRNLSPETREKLRQAALRRWHRIP